MPCRAKAAADHRQLTRRFRDAEHIHATTLPPEETPSGRPETTIVCREGPRGTVPTDVTDAIADTDLAIVRVRAHEMLGYRRVLVR